MDINPNDFEEGIWHSFEPVFKQVNINGASTKGEFRRTGDSVEVRYKIIFSIGMPSKTEILSNWFMCMFYDISSWWHVNILQDWKEDK